MMAAAKMVDGEVECDLCTMVLKYVDAIHTKNASEVCVAAACTHTYIASV